jgi:hypothetical protein
MKVSQLISNDDNPRRIKDDRLDKLCNSIKDFPKMMELRPIVIDKDNIVIGGNMRFKALKKLGYDEIPDGWVRKAEDLTPREIKRFVIQDNASSGEWDVEKLITEWDAEDIEEWSIDVEFVEKNKDVVEIDNELQNVGEPLYPIVPRFDEKYDLLFIVCENEIETNFIREVLDMQNMQSYKSDKVKKSNCISASEFIEKWKSVK